MNIYKVLTTYAFIFIFLNLALYAKVAEPFPNRAPDVGILGTISHALGVIKSLITFPFKVLTMLASQNIVLALIYAMLVVPAYLVVGYIFVQAIFWLISKLGI